MRSKVLDGHLQIAVLAVLGPQLADLPMGVYFSLAEHLAAVAALAVAMVLLLVVLEKVLIVHFSAGGALEDVPAAVAEVRGRFGDGDLLAAVGADLALFHRAIILMVEDIPFKSQIYRSCHKHPRLGYPYFYQPAFIISSIINLHDALITPFTL